MAEQSNRTAKWVLARVPTRMDYVVISRRQWPLPGCTFISSHRTKDAAYQARDRALERDAK